MATRKTGKLSKEGLLKDLKALGLEHGDVVLMHSNLRTLASVKEILAAPDGGMRRPRACRAQRVENTAGQVRTSGV